MINGVDIKFSFVGDVEQCPDGCSVKPNYASLGYEKSPNEDWSADGMASVFVHELTEAVTDPDVTSNPAWTDPYGAENGDKCAWTFGTPYVTNNGCSLANVVIGPRNFIIQQDWIFDSTGTGSGACGLHL
jgi:hypothetical protein